MIEDHGKPVEDHGKPVEDHGIICVRAGNPSFMTGSGTNTWIVGNVVIDPGPDDPAHLDAILACAPSASHILVTHAHADHCAGADALKAATGAKLLAGRPSDGCEPDELVVDGWRTNLGCGVLRAISSPGHTSDHFCFLLDQFGFLFSGDHVLEGLTAVIAPLDGDMTAYMQSVRRIDGLLLDAIYPGHGEIIEEPHKFIKQLLAHRREREQNILEALTWRVEATAAELLDDVYRPIEPYRREVAEQQIWAHLRSLQDQDLVTASDRDDSGAVWAIAKAPELADDASVGLDDQTPDLL